MLLLAGAGLFFSRQAAARDSRPEPCEVRGSHASRVVHGKRHTGYAGLIKKCGSGSISRVLSLRFSEGVIIPLALTLLPGSSDLPGSFERATLQRSPIWSCSGWGLPCQPCHQGRGELLPRLFTLTPRQARGGMFSVALSLGSPPVAVSDHPALWSSDFPPAARSAWRAVTQPPSAIDKKSNLAHSS
jgi:hypothetical protein